MGLALLNFFPPRMAVQILGHRPSLNSRFTVCLPNVCSGENTKVGLREWSVSHLLLETSVALGVICACCHTDGLAGQRGKLSMVIERWVPHVECSETRQTHALFACQSALDEMPTSALQQVFGAQGTPFIDVALPKTYSDRQSNPYASRHIPTR